MIKLIRLQMEEPLQTRMSERATRLRKLLNDGIAPPQSLLDSYRDPDLKVHLKTEVNDKCIYCESKITHVYFGDIEHIKPKAIFPAERLDISNLALACAACNNRKGDYWSEEATILNPYVDEPDQEILSLGFMIARIPGKQRARITITKLELNRPALLERRQERIELIQPLVDEYALAPEGDIKKMLRAELCKYAAASGEYSFTVRAYLEATCGLECEEVH